MLSTNFSLPFAARVNVAQEIRNKGYAVAPKHPSATGDKLSLTFAGGENGAKPRRASSVDHFARLVEDEMANPQSKFSSEELKTAAQESARDRAGLYKGLSEKPVRHWHMLSPKEETEDKSEKPVRHWHKVKTEDDQMFKAWKAYADGNPIPEGVPYDAYSKRRAKQVLSNVLGALKPENK